MIKLNRCYNTKNIKSIGLEVSTESMSLVISEGVFNYFDKTFNIPSIEIPFDVMDIERKVNIFLVNDIDNPIYVMEELEVTNEEAPDPIYCIASFYIPANTTDLSTIDIDVWQYGYEKEKEARPVEKKAPKNN